ncbi:MAG TPA: hypothetical protein VHF47_05985 [Acidimicrobiales bacterium]|jgi:hypothetical protein|nr:hypothetical protein [Acidimicrobiales bacterium]
MHKRFAPILLVLALVTAGCGDGDDSKALTEATLQGYLLTQAEVPSGFTQQEVEEEEESEEKAADEAACLEQDTDETVPAEAEASAEFATAEGISQISHEVQAYEAGKAAEAMAEGRRIADQCKTFEEVVEGTTMRGTFESVDFPSMGDDTAAFSLKASITNVPLNGMMVAVRKGDVVSAVVFIVANAEVDRAVVEDLVRKATAKVA